MIGWLHGEVVARDPARGVVVVATAGVGYEVRVSLQTLASVGDLGTRATLWIHTHAREDLLCLYGFATPGEKELFLMLLAVPKVGPQSAMAVLGGFPLADLVVVIAASDAKALVRIPGIGRKTAEQIILSLADRVADLAGPIGSASGEEGAASSADEALRAEARAVLVSLGWRQKQVDAALDSALAPGDGDGTLDGLVRRALAGLMDR